MAGSVEFDWHKNVYKPLPAKTGCLSLLYLNKEFSRWLGLAAVKGFIKYKLFLKLVAGLVCTFFLAGCSSTSLLNGYNYLSRPANMQRQLDLSYATGERQKMDVYQPKSTTGSKHQARTIFFVYGGTWKSGEKEYYEFVAANLVRQGHTVVIPNYRLYPDVRYPAFVDDVAMAIASYEQQVLPADQQEHEIVLMGHSAGAYTAALLATNPEFFEKAGVNSKVIGLIALSGPHDLPLDDPDVVNSFSTVKDPEKAIPVRLVQNSVQCSDHSNCSSPLEFSTLLLHAPDDKRVFYYHSERFRDALSAAGMKVKLAPASGGHIKLMLALARPLGFLNNTRAEILAFLNDLTE